MVTHWWVPWPPVKSWYKSPNTHTNCWTFINLWCLVLSVSVGGLILLPVFNNRTLIFKDCSFCGWISLYTICRYMCFVCFVGHHGASVHFICPPYPFLTYHVPIKQEQLEEPIKNDQLESGPQLPGHTGHISSSMGRWEWSANPSWRGLSVLILLVNRSNSVFKHIDNQWLSKFSARHHFQPPHPRSFSFAWLI